MTRRTTLLAVMACCAAAGPVAGQSPVVREPGAPATRPATPATAERYLAPVAIAAVGQEQLAVLGSTGSRLLLLDRVSGQLQHTIPLPAEASGMTVWQRTAYVTTNEPAGCLLQIDLDNQQIERTWRVGHMPTAPVIDGAGSVVFVANRFEHRVRSIDLVTGVQRSAEVIREPIAMALDSAHRRLFVANHLPQVRPFLDDENPTIYAEVSVIDTRNMEPIATVQLPNGSQALRGIALSPHRDIVAVTHVLSNYVVPTMEIARGAMNRNALSLIRTDSNTLLATLILDDPDLGAANPWGVCFTEGSANLLISHAGTHEISIIDWQALLDRAAERNGTANLFDDASLTAMTGIRQRIQLPLAGPRALCEKGGTIYTAGYFSDDIVAVDLHHRPPTVRTILAEPRGPASLARRGERFFNDATLCYQHWQSCATCHPDGRSDALYWDLLNDGIGNTKNTKSLLMAALTPPVMSRGVRANAGLAVAAGIRHIQFSEPSPDQAQAIEQYLLEMKTIPSPNLNADVLESPKTEDTSCSKCHHPGVPRGTLRAGAERGKKLFEGKAGCSACHPHPLFTSLQTVDGGLGTSVQYDVPSLVEVWRTAPYLHHGDALSLEETVTDYNHLQMRGTTKDLSPNELADLLDYLRSL